MEEEVHKAYGGEIPDVEGDHDHPNVDMSAINDFVTTKEGDEAATDSV